VSGCHDTFLDRSCEQSGLFSLFVNHTQ
jgi:hypothetical protein